VHAQARGRALAAAAIVALLGLSAAPLAVHAQPVPTTLTLSLVPNALSPTTPKVMGVNIGARGAHCRCVRDHRRILTRAAAVHAGHRSLADTTWLAYIQHLGVNGAPLGALSAPLPSRAPDAHIRPAPPV
jgi:hypothetical protein